MELYGLSWMYLQVATVGGCCYPAIASESQAVSNETRTASSLMQNSLNCQSSKKYGELRKKSM